MAATRSKGRKTFPEAGFARALRRFQEACQADIPEEQLAQALCCSLEEAPGIAACALYLDGRLAASSPNWDPLSAGAAALPLTAGNSEIGSLHVTISDPSQWRLYEPYAATAVQLAALRIANARQARELEEIRELERNARLGEERYRILADNSADAILLTTEDGSVRYANPAACRMFGRQEAEIRRLGRSVLADPADRRLQAALESRLRTGHWSGELNLLRADGTTFPADVSSIVFTDSIGARQVSTFIRDVSRRKQAEQELRGRHELMRYVIEHMRSGVAVLDTDLRHIYVSQRFLEEIKQQDTDVIGKLHYDVFPEIPEPWREAHRRALAGEVMSAECDRFERPDGSVFWSRWECRPWYNAVGAIGGIVLYTEVINARIEAEEERRRLQAQLAQAQKMESIGRLAGGVAHDFNNLLTVINGYSELALGRLGPGDPLRNDLEQIRKSGERAAALTRQLLAFSRKQRLQPQPLDLNQIVREIEPMLRRLMGERIRVRMSLHGDRLGVLADQHQMEQVVVNLAVNARDAMPEGGELSIETAHIELDETATKSQPEAKAGSYALLSVTDTGAGMNEETRVRIFEPFFTTKQVGQGTGLGLSMVHGIVAQSGGFIDVTSEPGKGSTFKLYLPSGEGAPGSAVSQAELAAPRGKETVLVVEDEIEVRRYAADALAAYGYRVVPCGSAAEALAFCEKPDQAVDLVVTDIVMPDIGGPELATRLAALRPGIPVVFMSGYPGDASDDAERREGVPFLQKPFSAAELAGKVSGALGSPPKVERT